MLTGEEQKASPERSLHRNDEPTESPGASGRAALLAARRRIDPESRVAASDRLPVGEHETIGKAQIVSCLEHARHHFEPLADLDRPEEIDGEAYRHRSGRRVAPSLADDPDDRMAHGVVSERADQPAMGKAAAIAVRLPYAHAEDEGSVN